MSEWRLATRTSTMGPGRSAVLNPRYLAWNARNIPSRLLSIPSRSRSDLALEETREVRLIREAGFRRDGRKRRVAAGQLRSRPGQTKASAVLADRKAVARSKGAGQVRGMHADQSGELRQANAVADSRTQQLFGRTQPRLRPAELPLSFVLATGHGEQLERKPFGRERRGGVGSVQLGGKSPPEPAEPAVPKLEQPVKAAGGGARLPLRPHDDDSRPLRAETGAVPGS